MRTSQVPTGQTYLAAVDYQPLHVPSLCVVRFYLCAGGGSPVKIELQRPLSALAFFAWVFDEVWQYAATIAESS
jgi:hypothetical protein